MMSSPHYAKGQGVVIGVSSSGGEWSKLANRWHLSHRWTNVLASICIDGQ